MRFIRCRSKQVKIDQNGKSEGSFAGGLGVAGALLPFRIRWKPFEGRGAVIFEASLRDSVIERTLLGDAPSSLRFAEMVLGYL
jgi:hypothetical protein